MNALYKQKIATQSNVIQALEMRITSMSENQVSKQTDRLRYFSQGRFIDALVHQQGKGLVLEMGKIRRKQQEFNKYITTAQDEATAALLRNNETKMASLLNDKILVVNQFEEFRKFLTLNLAK